MGARSKAAMTALAALVAASACTSSTRIGADGDADGDADEDVGPTCAEDLECEGAGLDVDDALALDAEVVEVDGDRAVFIGADGLPLTFGACGLGLAGLLSPGEQVRVVQTEPRGRSGCWVSTLSTDDGPFAAAVRCSAEGPVQPDLSGIGWTTRLSTACEDGVDVVCTGSEGPQRLRVPRTLHAVEVTTESSARGTVEVGDTAAVGEWTVEVLAASSTEAVDEAGCFIAATGQSLLVAVRQPRRSPCGEVPEVDRSRLGLSISADETVRDLWVLDVTEDLVTLQSDEGVEVTFGWYGPDPRRALSPGQLVTARRYPRSRTGAGLLDVLLVAGEPVLAVTFSDPFSLEVPDLSAIGLAIELGEPCVFEAGVSECSGETLRGERYPLFVTDESGLIGEVSIGSTELVGDLLVTLVEATQYPGVFCPDYHVEAWGPFGLTAIREGL